MASMSMKDVVNAECERTGEPHENLEDVDFRLKFLTKMDVDVLAKLQGVKRIRCSTNMIEKMVPFPDLKNLEILSLGRNSIKKIEGLDNLKNLKQLWISYNVISTLDGLSGLPQLETLYMSNNKISNWDELKKLEHNKNIFDVLFVGNPIYNGLARNEAQMKVLELVPQVTTNAGGKVDGIQATLIQSGGGGEDE